jgi:hypothetical protein
LGASTEALSRGLKAGVKVTPKCIHAYDLAIWNRDGFDKYLSDPKVKAKLGSARYEHGQSYWPLLQKLLEEHQDLVDFRIGDIVKKIHSDQPVEIAFYDLLKNYERDWAVFQALGPKYISGKTLIIQQDYFYDEAIDCKIRQEFLAPYFEFVGAFGTSGVFRLVYPLPNSYFERDPLLSLSVNVKGELLRQAADRIPLSKYQMYASLAIVRFWILNGMKEQAAAELSRQERVISESKPTSPRVWQIVKYLWRQIEDFAPTEKVR